MTREELRKLMREPRRAPTREEQDRVVDGWIKRMTHGGWDDYPVCMCPNGEHRGYTGKCAHGVSTAPCMDCPKCDAETQDLPFNDTQAFDDRKVDP